MTSDDQGGFIRTVLGDRTDPDFGIVYAHEHLIIDSLLIESVYPHIHLHDVDSAVDELGRCAAAGVGLVLDAMPCASGRDVERLTLISRRSGVGIVSATGLHHDRYYGPTHWTNRVGIDALVELFVADLVDGIDRFDYTGPLVHRTRARAGVVKVATSGADLDARDLRNLEAVARASVLTGAPILTHCEGGAGAIGQVERLVDWGVPASAIVLSHVDKAADLSYLTDVAATGAVLEFDQALRTASEGATSFTAKAIVSLIDSGFGAQIVVGTDGARRSLWQSHGGQPGLAWLAADFPGVLTSLGVTSAQVAQVMRENASKALRWRPAQI